MNNIYNKIRVIRESKGLRKSEVADRLGIHRSAYGRMEKTGSPQVTVERLEELAKIFEIEVSDFFPHTKKTIEESKVIEVLFSNFKKDITGDYLNRINEINKTVSQDSGDFNLKIIDLIQETCFDLNTYTEENVITIDKIEPIRYEIFVLLEIWDTNHTKDIRILRKLLSTLTDWYYHIHFIARLLQFSFKSN